MSRSRRAGELAAAIGLLLAGVVTVVLSRRLPYWHEFAPGPGFVPLWLGTLLSVVAAFELFVLLKRSAPMSSPAVEASGDEDPPLTRRTASLGVLSVVAALLVAPLGFVLAMAVFVAGASWLIDPERRFTNAAATVAIPLCIWILFVAWLGVPLPRGPLGF